MSNLFAARSFLTLKSAAVALLLVSLGACGGGGAKSPSADTPTPVAVVTEITLTTNSGNSEINSDGATTVTINADVKGAGSLLLAAQPVSFSANSGSLSVPSAVTDENGRATAVLGVGGNKTNREITITVTSGGLTRSTTVSVSGTKLTISAPSSLVINSTSSLTIFLKDSAGNGISGQQITMSSGLGNAFAPGSIVTTNQTGQATVNLTANVGGSETITASALGATTAQGISISTTNFAFTSPSAGTEVNIGSPQVLSIHYDNNGVNQVGVPVNFSNTRGTVPSSVVNTDSNGNASVTVQSNTAGIGTITASVTGGPTTTRDIEFVATTPSLMNLSASPAVVGVNSATSSNQQSTLSAQIKDGDGNLVKSKTINFVLSDTTGGRLSPGSAVTDSQGIASTVYTAGTTTSAQNGVTVTASVSGFSSVTASAKLTVARQALFVDLGTDNTVRKTTNQPTYEKDYSVYVLDAGRAPVKGATITVTLTPLTYGKGRYVYSTNDSAWVQVPSITGFPGTACANEDINNNGQLDFTVTPPFTEDTNTDGLLTPGGVATITASAVTDDTGFGVVTIKYPSELGNWVKVRLEARASVAASEGTGRIDFVLPVLASDFVTKTTNPPGNPSRYGQGTSCTDTL